LLQLAATVKRDFYRQAHRDGGARASVPASAAPDCPWPCQAHASRCGPLRARGTCARKTRGRQLRRVVLTWRFHVLHEFQEFQGGEQGKSASTFLLICCGKTYIWKLITTGTPRKLPARINIYSYFNFTEALNDPSMTTRLLSTAPARTSDTLTRRWYFNYSSRLV